MATALVLTPGMARGLRLMLATPDHPVLTWKLAQPDEGGRPTRAALQRMGANVARALAARGLIRSVDSNAGRRWKLTEHGRRIAERLANPVQ